jgi:hypothetical protein
MYNPSMPGKYSTFSMALLLCLASIVEAGCTSAHFRPVKALPEVRPVLDLKSLDRLEYHSAVVFNGSKIGFSRFTLGRAANDPGLFEVRSEAAFVLKFLFLDKRFSLRSYDLVKSDLSLVRFSCDYDIDGSTMHVEGECGGGGITTRSRTSGGIDERTLHPEGTVYPVSVIYQYLAMKGLEAGRVYEPLVYDGETRGVSRARLEVLACEESDLFDGRGFKVKTVMHGQEVTAWIDESGRPLLEIAMGGVLISGLESDRRALEYLARNSVNKGDVLLDLSLVKTDEHLSTPRGVDTLEVVLTGVDPGVDIPSDGRQRCTLEDGSIRCLVDARLGAGACAEMTQQALKRCLGPSIEVPCDSERLAKLSREIVTGGRTGMEAATAIVSWMGEHIRKEPVDAFTALDVLESGKAECQGHALLYAALARAAGIPTKVVSGLVYSDLHGGFLYHAWVESCVDGQWLAIDPTFGQLRADATHIKLVEGESLGDLVVIAGLVGRLQARIVSSTQARQAP